MGAKRVTLRDVAAASGVSRSTAGFVLRDTPNISISPATRERVRQAARDLGYVPHGIARALREGSSRIVVLTIDSGLEGNYSRSYIRGLDDELARHGHVLFVRHGHTTPESAQQVIDAIAPLAVLRFGQKYLMPGHEYDDGGQSGGLAGNIALQFGYLAERGHTRTAMALPGDQDPLGPIRLRFAREAARTLGLPPPRVLTLPPDHAACAAAARTFRGAHGDVTAVAAASDEVALRLLAALRELGVAVPDDLAVIGFDESGYGALTTPALTTVRIDAEDHGRNDARTILGLDPSPPHHAPAEVIVRESA
ncbi:LacI family transcriptional regulator [Actinomadura sp. NBRC 104412]|uniref:LacI family DNA-binding transcriptional regulator n=1 Tax=Actinomadura sp. NBRC 104412 TaxID=3032203 RepID=UPI0024A3FE54|nr:LacI family DNA-binding transcriptional regulator [Actinomadura sp. NBRC 104412]GLZ06117.1 LacI family transcriptional regulator [Actinomadura sp. NBRC 104412]